MIHTSMSRGVVVLDENILELQQHLQDHNMRVLTAPVRTKDDTIIRTLLPGRILITNNQDDFNATALAFEFGVIQVSQAMHADPAKAVQKISSEITKRRLWSNKPFILSLSLKTIRYKKLSE